jgi:hypothetical protein
LRTLNTLRSRLLLRNIAILDLVALPLGVLAIIPNELLLTRELQVASVYDVLLVYLLLVYDLFSLLPNNGDSVPAEHHTKAS